MAWVPGGLVRAMAFSLSAMPACNRWGGGRALVAEPQGDDVDVDAGVEVHCGGVPEGVEG